MRKVLTLVLALMLVCTSALAGTELLNEPGVLPIVNDNVKIVVGTPAIATVTDYDDNHLTNYLREKTGIDIEVYLYDAQEYKTQFQLATSSGEKLPDTLWSFSLTPMEREAYGTQEYFIDLLPYFQAHELTYYFDGEAASFLTEAEKEACFTAGLSSNGALYAFPFWAEGVADAWSDGFMINNTFLEALNMEMPTTIDELYEYLVAVKNGDPNGNGIADEIPLIGFNGWTGKVVMDIVNSYTYFPDSDDLALCCTDDGKIYVPYQTEEFREALRFVNKLYTEGLLSDLTFSQDRYGLQAMVDVTDDQPDIIGCAAAHRSLMFANHNTAERRTHYTAMAPIAGPNGVAYCASYAIEPLYRQFITCDCAEPEVAFRLIDFLTSTECTMMARYGSEGTYWRWATDEEKVGGNQLAELGYEGTLYITGPEVCWGQENNEIWNTASITWQPVQFCGLGYGLKEYDNPITEYNVNDWNHGTVTRFGQAPKNQVGSLAYTAEEQAALGTMPTDIGNYVFETTTRFCVGELSLDDDWDDFQAALEQMGLPTVLEYSQNAWDRAHA